MLAVNIRSVNIRSVNIHSRLNILTLIIELAIFAVRLPRGLLKQTRRTLAHEAPCKVLRYRVFTT